MMSAQLQQQQREQQSPQPNGVAASAATQSSADRLATDAVAGSVLAPQSPALPELTNRAGESDSPYVRLHAETPVAWQPLDEATLARATAENKPIFMHIGFLADHHCRLTSQDSFSNPQVAAFLNGAFIPIIIDRDERPDLDTIYQNYSEAVNATGGWPLNLFLTPDLYPIFGGTYWPGPGTEHSLLLASSAAGRQSNPTTGGSGSGGGGGPDDDDTEEPCNDFLSISKKIWVFWQEQEERCRREAFEMLGKLLDFAQEGTFTDPPSTPGIVLPSFNSAATPQQPEPEQKPAKSKSNDGSDLDLDQVEEALDRITKMFDTVHCGFGTPKFPNPARLSFLLRVSQFPKAVRYVVGDEETENATYMALSTLRRIRDGGLRDHAGGGFMRFSVTRDWSMPHFEKMVGENALLLGVFLDAWLATSGPNLNDPDRLKATDEFADVVFELGDYLTDPDIWKEQAGVTGGSCGRPFVTSEAADSLHRKGDRNSMREGAYYLWTRREFDDVVGGNYADQQHASLVAAAYWNVRENGNVPRDQDPHDEFINQNVLHVTKDVRELSRQFGIPESEVKRIVTEAKEKLRLHREKERARPIRDDKIIGYVNGMAISALARTGAAIKKVDPERSGKYLAAARAAAEFVRDKLWVDDGKGEGKKLLKRFFFEKPSKTAAFADDYAFLIEGVLDLFEADLELEWLEWARDLQDTQTRIFYDSPALESSPGPRDPRQSGTGGFYPTEAETLSHTILRLKSGMDKSQPSTNSVSAMNLYRLGHLLLSNDKSYISQAKETVYAFESEMLQHPWLYGSLLAGVVTARLGFKRQRVFLQYVKSDRGRERYYTTPRSSARALELCTCPLPEHVDLPESGDEGEGEEGEKEGYSVSGACTGEKGCHCCECMECNCLGDRIEFRRDVLERYREVRQGGAQGNGGGKKI